MNNQTYFERQGTLSMQCGMHSINNLLKKEAYSKSDMENICYELSDEIINPHKHILGGDYDVNVIMLALKREGYECQWIDNRKQFVVPQNSQGTLGYLINTAQERKLYHRMLGLSARHWTAIRVASNNKYEACDSKKEEIQIINDKKQLEAMITQKIGEGAEIIWVYK